MAKEWFNRTTNPDKLRALVEFITAHGGVREARIIKSFKLHRAKRPRNEEPKSQQKRIAEREKIRDLLGKHPRLLTYLQDPRFGPGLVAHSYWGLDGQMQTVGEIADKFSTQHTAVSSSIQKIRRWLGLTNEARYKLIDELGPVPPWLIDRDKDTAFAILKKIQTGEFGQLNEHARELLEKRYISGHTSLEIAKKGKTSHDKISDAIRWALKELKIRNPKGD